MGFVLAEFPGGTVTFLMTDIEGSTLLLQRLRDTYAELLADHARLLEEAIGRYGGRVVDTQGDAVFAAFGRARDGVLAAASAQRTLAAHPWPQGVDVRVRMGLHTGEPQLSGERYVGLAVHRVARICSAAHGGQVLLSQITAALVEDELTEGVELRELGVARLKDLERPERLSQLVVEGLASEFAPPRIEVGAQPFAGKEDALAREVVPGSKSMACTDRSGGLGVVGGRRVTDPAARRPELAGDD